jgi:uncharacterized damage-inducible protein DinB
MSFAAVTLEDLLADFDLTATRWKEFFAAKPAAADVPTDISESGNVGGLVWHLYMAAVVHSQRLLGGPVIDFAATTPVRDQNIDGAWRMHEMGSANLRRFLAATDDSTLDTLLHMRSREGIEIQIRRRKLCLHIFVHAIRHWAQIGPLVRQHGFPVGWPQDISFSSAIPETITNPASLSPAH